MTFAPGTRCAGCGRKLIDEEEVVVEVWNDLRYRGGVRVGRAWCAQCSTSSRTKRGCSGGVA